MYQSSKEDDKGLAETRDPGAMGTRTLAPSRTRRCIKEHAKIRNLNTLDRNDSISNNPQPPIQENSDTKTLQNSGQRPMEAV